MKKSPSRRGTSNSNERGNSTDRLNRRRWLVKTFQSDIAEDLVRCYRCGIPLDEDSVTVDRIVPGVHGGRYVRGNIRPACDLCNSSVGGAHRKGEHS